MDLTVIIPYYNGGAHLGRLLASLPAGLPALVVDDRSDEPPAVDRPNTRTLQLVEKGYFAGAVNAGLANTTGDVLILNQDTWLEGDDWLRLLEEKRGEYGLIGEGVMKHPAWPKGYIHGTFMYIRQDVVEAAGLLDGRYYPLWGGTCDYQARACRRGFKALPLAPGTIPGFHHSRQGNYGDGIAGLLKREPDKRGLLIRTPPLISVVINCYNQGRFLRDALNSLIGGPTGLAAHIGEGGQTFQGFEVVIVDDGSTDDTPAICNQLANDWQGVKVIHQRNRGSAAAMNAGMQAAHGKYIAPLDSDDMMKPARLERMVAVLEANPHSVIYDDPAYFAWGQLGITTDRHSSKLTYTMPLPRVYDFERVVYKNNMHKGIMFPRKAWEECGGYPEVMDKGREDWAFNVALGIHGYCGIHTGAAEYLYRREGHNRTLTNTTPKAQNSFRAQLEQLYPDIYRGERPTMCCGNKRPSGGAAPRGVAPAGGARALSLPGQAGMVLLEYTGLNAGNETWTNANAGTGRTYIFGGARRIGYVEAKDAEWMLKVRVNGRDTFKVHTPPPKATPPAAPKAIEMPPPILKQAAPKVIEMTPPPPAVEEPAPVVEVITPPVAPSPEAHGLNRIGGTRGLPDLAGMSITKLKETLKDHNYPRSAIRLALVNEKRPAARKLLEAAIA